MRLWHKDLIMYLPDKQILGQWRECCAIARNIKDNGTPNHILVNRIMDYPLVHFHMYGFFIFLEMQRRGFNADLSNFDQHFSIDGLKYVSYDSMFKDWHDIRYLIQCFYNLQEKYDCGGIPNEQWMTVVEGYKQACMRLTAVP